MRIFDYIRISSFAHSRQKSHRTLKNKGTSISKENDIEKLSTFTSKASMQSPRIRLF